MLYHTFRHFLVPEPLQDSNINLSNFTLAVNEKKGSSVPVSLECTSPPEATSTLSWTMKLQRYNPSTKAWNTIGTRTGYTSEDSPSNRTFTSVAKTGEAMRVILTDLETDFHGPSKSIESSPQWMY